jgi:hypothetical protein
MLVYPHKPGSMYILTRNPLFLTHGQFAAVAHLPDAIPSSVRQSRIGCGKKKQEKQQRKLLEIVLPSHFYPTVSIVDINEDIILFDGGNSDCPPITPPKGVQWRRLLISDLFIQDDL